jgi:hypothetical protein
MDSSALENTPAFPVDPTVIRVLTGALEEIRWNHPRVRICAGLFVAPNTVRFLASSQPTTMSPLGGTSVEGEGAASYLEVLEETRDVLQSADVTSDDRLARVPARILGDDTRSTLTLPLRDGADVVGFVRMDGRDDEFISARAIRALLTATDTAILAARLQPEVSRLRKDARDNSQLLQWLGEHVEHQRHALESIRAEVVAATKTLEALGKSLEPSTHRTLRSLCERLEEAVEGASSTLGAHLDQAPDREIASAARVPVSGRSIPADAGTPRASGRSTVETRG